MDDTVILTYNHIAERRIKMEHERREEVISEAEIAQVLGVHPGSVKRWIRAGELPSTKIGGRIFVSRKAFLKRLEEPRKAGAANDEPNDVQEGGDSDEKA